MCRWRSDALSDAALDVLLEPHLEMVARAALREARGKQARRRDAAERDLVRTKFALALASSLCGIICVHCNTPTSPFHECACYSHPSDRSSSGIQACVGGGSRAHAPRADGATDRCACRTVVVSTPCCTVAR
eukprot:scaffold138381_cov36-Tisochrysis_lutea.AAC.7